MIYHNSVKHILAISLTKGNFPMFLIVMVIRLNARISTVDQQAFRVFDAGNTWRARKQLSLASSHAFYFGRCLDPFHMRWNKLTHFVHSVSGYVHTNAFLFDNAYLSMRYTETIRKRSPKRRHLKTHRFDCGQRKQSSASRELKFRMLMHRWLKRIPAFWCERGIRWKNDSVNAKLYRVDRASVSTAFSTVAIT